MPKDLPDESIMEELSTANQVNHLKGPICADGRFFRLTLTAHLQPSIIQSSSLEMP